MTDKTDSKEREALRSIGEEQAFEAWFKVDCPVEGANAKIAAKAAWKARASLAASAGSEPVATVFTMEALAPGGGVKYHATVHKPLPAGTKLYTHPSPPEGMVMVPKEPTMAMRIAAKTADMDHTNLSDWMVSDWPEFKRIWDAMLKAAPPTSSADSSKEQP